MAHNLFKIAALFLILLPLVFLSGTVFFVIYLVFLLVVGIILAVALHFTAKIGLLTQEHQSLSHFLKSLESNFAKTQYERNKALVAIANINIGIIVLSTDNKVNYINNYAQRVLEVQAKDLIHKSLLDLGRIPVFAPIVKLIDGLDGFWQRELVVQKDLILEISLNQLIVHGKQAGRMVVFYDVTKEREAVRAKADFISLAVHQLNMPLSAMRLSLEMLADGDFGPVTRQQKGVIDKIYERSKMLVSLVSDLAAIDKMEEKGYEYECVDVDLMQLVKTAIDFNKEEAQVKKLSLKFEKPTVGLPLIKADQAKIAVVVENLINNAVKYTPRGGKVVVSIKKVDKGIEFCAKDSGIGIPENQQDKIFTKFFRASNAKQMEVSGSGLGLFIVKTIIENHHGKTWFNSRENGGSEFFFSIPLNK